MSLERLELWPDRVQNFSKMYLNAESIINLLLDTVLHYIVIMWLYKSSPDVSTDGLFLYHPYQL